MNTIYLLIGGNTGNRIKNLQTAVSLLAQQVGKITRQSSLYETAAWGNTNQPDFLNQVLKAETLLDANECLQQLFLIEHKMGRVRTEKNAPRNIDIDILFFNNDIINEPHLIIPHPQIQNRKFVLVPMNELSRALIHPVLHQTIAVLLSACTDTLEVRLVSNL